MSDYYCPNCGNDLGDQTGFDPDEGFWKCTQCGEELYGDDSVDDYMNRFPGVVWHCDGCGAVLNKQCGFDDWMPIFTCKKCGTLNFINEDEIRDNPTDVGCSTNDEDGSHLGAIVNPFNSVSQQADTIGDIKSRHADGLSPSDSTVSSLNDENNDDEAEEGSAVHHDDNEGEANASYASNSESTRQDQASKFEGLSYDEGPSFKSLFLSLAFVILLVACMIACPDETFDVAKKLGMSFWPFSTS